MTRFLLIYSVWYDIEEGRRGVVDPTAPNRLYEISKPKPELGQHTYLELSGKLHTGTFSLVASGCTHSYEALRLGDDR
jgi:hypothetical protein